MSFADDVFSCLLAGARSRWKSILYLDVDVHYLRLTSFSFIEVGEKILSQIL